MAECNITNNALRLLNSSIHELSIAVADGLNRSLQFMSLAFETASNPSDPCQIESVIQYSMPLHISAIFVIFVLSAFGVAVPLLGSHYKRVALNDFVIVLGKCIATGVVLSCALIHMLLPANESLTSLCLPDEFSKSYPAYAFLFALLAALAMQLLDDTVERFVSSRVMASRKPRVPVANIIEPEAGHVSPSDLAVSMTQPDATKAPETTTFPSNVSSSIIANDLGAAPASTITTMQRAESPQPSTVSTIKSQQLQRLEAVPSMQMVSDHCLMHTHCRLHTHSRSKFATRSLSLSAGSCCHRFCDESCAHTLRLPSKVTFTRNGEEHHLEDPIQDTECRTLHAIAHAHMHTDGSVDHGCAHHDVACAHHDGGRARFVVAAILMEVS
jgi:hypothetical protein